MSRTGPRGIRTPTRERSRQAVATYVGGVGLEIAPKGAAITKTSTMRGTMLFKCLLGTSGSRNRL